MTEPDLNVLLSALNPLELFELGWDFNRCINCHGGTARDLRRAMIANPTLDKLGVMIDGFWMEDKHKTAARIKMFINNSLMRER